MRRGAGLALALLCVQGLAWAHGVSGGDKGFVERSVGAQLVAFAYLGAKHMVTGYDHLLFLFGVIFFLYRMKEVALYVTLFAVGHSVTLLYGVIAGTHASPYLVDALIGLSVVYKAMDNLGAFERWLGFRPDPRMAVLAFDYRGIGRLRDGKYEREIVTEGPVRCEALGGAMIDISAISNVDEDIEDRDDGH